MADCYGPRRAVADGVLPLTAVLSSAHFHRAAHGIEPANGVRVHVSGIDLIRDEQGDFRVLEDNVRVPSGVSYVLANRRAVSQLLPGAFGALGVRPVAEYPYRLLQALRAASTAPDPTVVVLSPGVYNSALFEHTLLARTMGVQLVEGRDLLCHDGRVWMRTTTGERRVDVIYRRVDGAGVAGAAALLRGARGLPSGSPRHRRGLQGGRVPAARPALPPVGGVRDAPGRGEHGAARRRRLRRPGRRVGGRRRRRPASALLGRARADLEYRSVPELLEDLPRQMQRVRQACSAASVAISGRYFPSVVATAWVSKGIS